MEVALAVGYSELIGYLAAILVFTSFYMKTMIPLRVVALGSNLAFIAYGIAGSLYPVLILHLALFPLNVLRLVQIRRLIRQVEEAAGGSLDVTVLLPHMKRLKLNPGEVLFRKGESADAMYYIGSGTLHLEEIDVRVGAGEVIGEIGLFSPRGQRMATAIADGPSEVYELSKEKIREYMHQNPAFGFALVQLITGRMLHNLQQAQARAGVSPGT